jgi:flagellum-specific peptidoglycan hydrolase FlgJ
MLNNAQKDWLKAAAKAAWESEKQTGFPAQITLAQAILETGWGQSQPGNNCFGIKAYKGCCGIQLLDTWEVINDKRVNQKSAFATFPTLAACFTKHALLLATGAQYQEAFRRFKALPNHSIQDLACDIAKHYATDPDYCEKLIKIMRMPEVKSAQEKASGLASS